MLHARNRGVGAIFIHALSENTPMLKIARDAGATVRRDGSESEAWLELPPDSFASHLDEIMVAQAAEFDYRVKAHLRRMKALLAPIDRRADASRGGSEAVAPDRSTASSRGCGTGSVTACSAQAGARTPIPGAKCGVTGCERARNIRYILIPRSDDRVVTFDLGRRSETCRAFRGSSPSSPWCCSVQC